MSQPRYITKVLTAASATAVCASQSAAAAGNLTINGGSASGGIATLDTQRQILFTFAADETGHSFVVYGKDDSGVALQETVAGAAATATTAQFFKTITRISISAASTGALTVGTNGVGGTPWQIVNSNIGPFNLGIGVAVSGTVNFTLQYTYDDPSGTYVNPYISYPTSWSLTALTSKSAATDSSITFPIAAYRLVINSGTGRATASVIQSGVADS